jgi:lipopolysaccharide export system permease protein
MRLIPGKIESYVLARTGVGVGGALALLGSVALLIDFVENSRNVGARAEVSFAELLGLTLLKTPQTILILLPFIFLFGTLAAFVSLNRRSELVAMRAAGVSAWRFIFPAAAAAFLAGLITATALNPLAAMMGARFEQTRAGLLEGYNVSAPKQIWLRQGDSHNEMIIRALSHDQQDGVVRLKGVSLFIYSRNDDGTLQFARRVEADEARLNAGFWRLKSVREATPGAGSIRSESLSIPSTLDSQAAMERFTTPEAVAFWRLPQAIAQTEAAGFSATAYKMRLWQLLATPLMFAAMSILAAAFSLRLMRLGGLSGLAISGVALGFAFFFFNQLCGALGKAGTLPPPLAAAAPPLLALLAGLTLLCYTEDG